MGSAVAGMPGRRSVGRSILAVFTGFVVVFVLAWLGGLLHEWRRSL